MPILNGNSLQTPNRKKENGTRKVIPGRPVCGLRYVHDSLLLQTQAYRVTGDRKYIDRAAREMVMYLDELQCPNGLFYHAPDVPFYWGRGNGWMAAGMAELLSSLPEDSEYRPRICMVTVP